MSVDRWTNPTEFIEEVSGRSHGQDLDALEVVIT